VYTLYYLRYFKLKGGETWQKVISNSVILATCRIALVSRLSTWSNFQLRIDYATCQAILKLLSPDLSEGRFVVSTTIAVPHALAFTLKSASNLPTCLIRPLLQVQGRFVEVNSHLKSALNMQCSLATNGGWPRHFICRI
jgi:ABC-type cobalamin transport system ATPase subunit